jgi:hypothetical protein
MSWPLALAYGTIPALVVVWSLVELWARSYDLPNVRRVAIAAEIIIFLLSGWAVGELAWAVGSRSSAHVLSWAAILPPVAALLLTMHDLDWRHVYASATVGVLLPLFGRSAPSGNAMLVPVGLALVMIGMLVHREFASVRLRRYTTALVTACSCCGHKQKAVREFFQLGDAGERVVREYLGKNDETRVAAEVARCRPTRG